MKKKYKSYPGILYLPGSGELFDLNAKGGDKTFDGALFKNKCFVALDAAISDCEQVLKNHITSILLSNFVYRACA